ncbi:MAG: DUF2225 domain-containing protein [Leptospiraceae bacterium]|nr:DUF2225 domain-containing protein [Leptospiraceae bacterium]MDW8307270.1 DUF2225 domain-containing protein [Leptospiraceae bacterium]
MNGAVNQNQRKVSYRAQKASLCPVCGYSHNKEEMLSGSGRLIAGKLTPELRRLYEVSKKWGRLNPLDYAVQVCPRCLYAAYPKDFEQLTPQEQEALKSTIGHRQNLMQVLFGKLDFNENRNLLLGCASFILAVDCYHLRKAEVAPTVKKAISAMRAAWYLDDLYKEAPYRPYDKARDFYYMEAARYYRQVLELMEKGGEPVDQVAGMLGPDLDNNWGYDGVIYLNSYLTKKYLDQMASDTKQKLALLEASKRYLSKLYGTGKASKARPSVIVDMAKDLYEEISAKIDELTGNVAPAAGS